MPAVNQAGFIPVSEASFLHRYQQNVILLFITQLIDYKKLYSKTSIPHLHLTSTSLKRQNWTQQTESCLLEDMKNMKSKSQAHHTSYGDLPCELPIAFLFFWVASYKTESKGSLRRNK